MCNGGVELYANHFKESKYVILRQTNEFSGVQMTAGGGLQHESG